MISFQNVSKAYGKSSVRAVDGLTLDIQPGEIVGFLGPNGAGKTTTIKMLVGMTRPDEGRVLVNGVDVMRDPIRAKQQIGYVQDSPEPYARLTGREYVQFIADVYGVSSTDRASRLPELLETFDLTSAFDDKIANYSRGMKQKITIIGALIHHPPVWVLDEPMVGLDPKSAHDLKDKMRQHCDKGNTVFFSTHVLDVAERVCDKIAIISKGKLITMGTMAELREKFGERTTDNMTSDTSLERLFLELTEA